MAFPRKSVWGGAMLEKLCFCGLEPLSFQGVSARVKPFCPPHADELRETVGFPVRNGPFLSEQFGQKREKQFQVKPIERSDFIDSTVSPSH